MEAQPGDRIIIRGTTVDSADKHGQITEVRGDSGHPPFAVKYDDGHETIIYPGGDFVLEKDSAVQ